MEGRNNMKKRPVVLVILDGWGMNHHNNEVDGVKLANPINFRNNKNSIVQVIKPPIIVEI